MARLPLMFPLIWPTMVALCSTVLAVGAACSDTCDAGEGELTRYSDGHRNDALTFYETGPIQGPYLHFPSGRIYELAHGLGVSPDTVITYLSFGSEALLSSDNNIAETAGNQAVIECVDGEVVRVRNDTCAEFYLRVVALVNTEPYATNTRPCR